MRAGENERRICNLFTPGETLNYKGKEHEILIAGKPTCRHGEPKTDIFVRLKSYSGEENDIKISYKMSSADFLENKISAERARDLLGEHWIQIVKDAVVKLEAKFYSRNLIFKERDYPTQRGSFTLGWKFEFVRAGSGGDLSCQLPLSDFQVKDVYAGSNLWDDKKNALVNGECILGSGVANFMLIEEESQPILTTEELLNQMITVEEYSRKNSVICCAFKAQNYRSIQGKVDSNRPLAVYVNWDALDGRLIPSLSWEEPLTTRSNVILEKLKHTLCKLGVSNTDQLTGDMLHGVNVHE